MTRIREQFDEAISDCLRWDGRKAASVSTTFWSAELKPRPELDDILDPAAVIPESAATVHSVLDGMASAVAHLVENRRRILQGGERRTRDSESGRILLFAPLLTLNDGLAEKATGGFFNACNCPAWDYWVGFVDHIQRSRRSAELRSRPWEACLVAYVPSSMVPLVERGVSVNAEGCIDWMDRLAESEGSVRDLLRRGGASGSGVGK